MVEVTQVCFDKVTALMVGGSIRIISIRMIECRFITPIFGNMGPLKYTFSLDIHRE